MQTDDTQRSPDNDHEASQPPASTSSRRKRRLPSKTRSAEPDETPEIQQDHDRNETVKSDDDSTTNAADRPPRAAKTRATHFASDILRA